MRKSKKVAIGTVSHGTLRSHDLIESFSEVLTAHGGYGRVVAEGRRVLRAGDEKRMLEYLDDVLFPAMEAIAPPFCGFHAHEGDGSDFGFWVDIEALNEAATCKDKVVVKVPAGNLWPRDLPTSVRYVAEVNDHGNVSLYHRSNRRVIWDIV